MSMLRREVVPEGLWDESLKKFFGALTVVEREHIDLINQYI
jgi:hypothetical protein